MTINFCKAVSTSRRKQSALAVRRSLLGAVLGLGLLGLNACGAATPAVTDPAPDASLPTFDYDGLDHSWVSPETSNVGTLSLAPGDNALSNEGWTTASNGWGPIERDMSVGEKNAGDGRSLSLSGKTYPQGFGVHANSSMSFNIAGQCSSFSSDIGLDDEVGSQGSVVFQVFADGVNVYGSGKMIGGDPAKSLNVDVSGKKELKLVVSAAGDGISYDHADWAAPTLTCGTALGDVIRIDAGGLAHSAGGVDWLACSAISNCRNFVSGGMAYSEPDAISNAVAPADAALYQTEWTGGTGTGIAAGQTAFEFKVPVVNGDYKVRLHFAELNKTAAGQRIFDVKLENQVALSNVDIFTEAGGIDRAILRELPVTVNDGLLNIAFIARVENAKVSGIEIIPVSVSAPAAGLLTDLPAELIFSGTQNAVSAPQTLTLHNASSAPLTITALNLGGANAPAFTLSGVPALPLSLAPKQSANVQVSFSPQSAVGALQASLQLSTDNGSKTLGLYGLSARGEQGDLEPPLQQIVNTLGYSINVGSSALILGTSSALIGDEVSASLFQKAGSGPVIMRAVARYSPDDLLAFGYYLSGSSDLKTVGTVALKQEQTLNPALTPGSATSFDPGSATFGFFTGKTSYAGQSDFTQESLNTGPTKHAVRVYPLKNRAGQPLPNQYLLAFEPSTNGDYNDYVFVVQNVKPLQASGALNWKEAAGAITAVSEAQGAVVNNKLYIFGGFLKDLKTTPKVQVYDPATNRWTAKRDMPEQLTHAAVVADGQIVYVAGGFVGDHPGPQTAHVWKYNAASDTWSAFTPLPAARGGGAMVLLGRTLHFAGGTERNPGQTDLYVRDTPDHWTLNLDNPVAWQSAAPLPNPRNHLAAAALNGKMYVMGGQHLGDEYIGTQSEVDMYNPVSNTWVKVASLPRAISHTNSSTVVWNNRIVMVAGVGSNSEKIADVYEYDPAANTWSALPALPAPRQSPVAGVINNRLIVSTGSLSAAAAFTTTWSGARQ